MPAPSNAPNVAAVAAPATAEITLPFGWRVGLSCMLLWHVTAVFIAPFTFATRDEQGSPSPAARAVMEPMSWYIDPLFLDHGYFFFAPNPGPSHLLRFHLEFADGRPPEDLVVPNPKQHRPRLLYHRHFMLTEELNRLYTPPTPPVGPGNVNVPANPEQTAAWQASRDMYEKMRDSYLRHVAETYGASRVTMTRVEHQLRPPPETKDVLGPVKLDEPATFVDLPEPSTYERVP